MSTTAPTARLQSIDILRGVVMVLMTLDHTRDYFTNFSGNLSDVSQATTGLFLTRWITHYCAPIFIFLAGTSAFFSLSKRKDKKIMSLFLLKRGLWLILLELTVIRFGWLFNIDYSLMILQVIWAIGVSMVCLGALIHLPYNAILVIGLAMVLGHNMLDGFHTNDYDFVSAVWRILHQGGSQPIGNSNLFVIYPVVPWIGVMALGYCMGNILQMPQARRNKILYQTGIGAILLFILLRLINSYGDPIPWQEQDSIIKTILSFVNCKKYPPSLLYLLMTLGPAIAVIPLLEKWKGAVANFFIVYGRVPLFYYIVHIYFVHLSAIILAAIIGVPVKLFTQNNTLFAAKQGWGFDLPYVYLAWLVIVVILYFPSKWFMKVKATHKKWWLSYL